MYDLHLKKKQHLTNTFKVDRARASFRQSLRLGRGRALRLGGYLTPPSDVTAAEEEEDTLEQW